MKLKEYATILVDYFEKLQAFNSEQACFFVEVEKNLGNYHSTLSDEYLRDNQKVIKSTLKDCFSCLWSVDEKLEEGSTLMVGHPSDD